MSQQEFIDIFNDCIERLARGQSIEDCLRQHPAYAAQLLPLLEAAVVVKRTPFPPAEVLEDQARVWARIEQALPTRMPARRASRPWGQALSFAAMLILLVGSLLVGYTLLVNPPNPAVETLTPTLTATATATQTPTSTTAPTATVTLTSTATQTPTAAPTSTPTRSAASTGTLALPATSTPAPATASRTPTATQAQTVIIQGPIEAIDGSVLTIYGLTVRLRANEPLLAQLRVGVQVRVEGTLQGNEVIAPRISLLPTTTPTSGGRGGTGSPPGGQTPPPANPNNDGNGSDDDGSDDNDDDSGMGG
ncbi:MAG: hypothetical protein HXY40_08260 [Chloroflexi bacterium]|nr:hypothetical protein [Chloroflexota bacterium]